MKKDIKKKARLSDSYILKSAELVSRAAYRMCKDMYGRNTEKMPDPKSLKETCSALKEAASLLSGLQRDNSPEAVRIVFEDIGDCAE